MRRAAGAYVFVTLFKHRNSMANDPPALVILAAGGARVELRRRRDAEAALLFRERLEDADADADEDGGGEPPAVAVPCAAEDAWALADFMRLHGAEPVSEEALRGARPVRVAGDVAGVLPGPAWLRAWALHLAREGRLLSACAAADFVGLRPMALALANVAATLVYGRDHSEAVASLRRYG